MKQDITNKISITEIARLTNKTRPSIYKYISEYKSQKYKDIPHAFVLLFNKIENDESKEEIIKFCEQNFKIITSNNKLNDLIHLLKENYTKLDLEKIENEIKEQLK